MKFPQVSLFLLSLLILPLRASANEECLRCEEVESFIRLQRIKDRFPQDQAPKTSLTVNEVESERLSLTEELKGIQKELSELQSQEKKLLDDLAQKERRRPVDLWKNQELRSEVEILANQIAALKEFIQDIQDEQTALTQLEENLKVQSSVAKQSSASSK